MGNVEYFLGKYFNCITHKDRDILVHLSQSAFTEFTAHHFYNHKSDKVHNMNPYRSGYPINSIPPVDYLEPDLPCQKQVYQIIVRCINWLATCTLPDISPTLTLIASYNNATHK